MADSKQQYLQVKNWQKFQPKLKNGKESRSWIRLDTHLEDDPEFSHLTFIQQAILISIWRLRGRVGKSIPNNAIYIARALHIDRTTRPHLTHAIRTLVSHGFLILSYQQNEVEFSTRDETRRDETRHPHNPPKGGYADSENESDDDAINDVPF